MAKTTTQPRMTGRGVTVPPGPSPGLSATEVERSRAEHGDNRLTERRQRGFFFTLCGKSRRSGHKGTALRAGCKYHIYIPAYRLV